MEVDLIVVLLAWTTIAAALGLVLGRAIASADEDEAPAEATDAGRPAEHQGVPGSAHGRLHVVA